MSNSESKNALVAAWKQEFDYTEEQNTCESCVHSKEVDGMIDRSWDWICMVNPHCQFIISKNGRCRLHTKKNK